MEACIDEGGLIACDVVWAEVSAFFPSADEAMAALRATSIAFSPLEPEPSAAAGLAWSEYRRRGGSRTRVVSDFLIGAHASAFADRLLTRDRGFYRSYFPDLTIIDPSAP